jgi:hypothetical protein
MSPYQVEKALLTLTETDIYQHTKTVEDYSHHQRVVMAQLKQDGQPY